MRVGWVTGCTAVPPEQQLTSSTPSGCQDTKKHGDRRKHIWVECCCWPQGCMSVAVLLPHQPGSAQHQLQLSHPQHLLVQHVPLYQQARLDLYQRLMTSRAQNNAGLVRPTMPVTDNSWMPVQGGGVSQGTRRSQQRKLLLHAFRPEHIHYSCHNCSPICAAACGPQPPAPPSLCQSHVTI